MEEQKPTENLSIVDEAKKVRDEIRAENDRREKLIHEDQKLQAEKMLAGNAGSHIEPMTAEQAQKAKAQKVADEMVSAFK